MSLVYEREGIRIIQGDSTDPSLLPPESIDVTITSPPYNISMDYDQHDDSMTWEEYVEFTRSWVRNVYTWTGDGGRLIVNVPVYTVKGGVGTIGSDFVVIAKEIG